MPILTWILVGLVSGVLAAMVVGGYGVLVNIIVGIAGAFVGGWVFEKAGWHAPFTGVAGVIFVAFVGALILLVLLRLVHRMR